MLVKGGPDIDWSVAAEFHRHKQTTTLQEINNCIKMWPPEWLIEIKNDPHINGRIFVLSSSLHKQNPYKDHSKMHFVRDKYQAII